MGTSRFYFQLSEARKKRKCLFAVLVDPDKYSPARYQGLSKHGVDLILAGGSLVSAGNTGNCVADLKKKNKLPVFLFPGHASQFCDTADGIFYLSLISGRNPELLIGQHVHSAMAVRRSRMEVIPTGYILTGGKEISSTQYVSGTLPIPYDKPELACATAVAGELLGLKAIYLEAGSGSSEPVPSALISQVAAVTSIPLICGGGIASGKSAALAARSGCSMIVAGNAIEKRPELIKEIGTALDEL